MQVPSINRAPPPHAASRNRRLPPQRCCSHSRRTRLEGLQQLHTWYSRLHNRLHGRGAHLFRAHFFAELESDADLLSTCRYVARNPVEAGLVRNPFAWRWSSAAATPGLAKPALSLDPEPLTMAFDGASDWQARYRAFVENIDDRKGRWS
jgi:hypothetical protein